MDKRRWGSAAGSGMRVCVGRLVIIVVVDGQSGVLWSPYRTTVLVKGGVAKEMAVTVKENNKTGN